MYPMLNTLPSLPRPQQPAFLSVLTELAGSNPHLFRPHIPALLKFLPSLLLPVVDAGPTPTVARPNPGGGSTFAFPPVAQSTNGEDKDPTGEDDEVRKAALEFMTTLSESKPGMLRNEPAWVEIVVRGCLEGMGEIPEDDTETWLEADPAEDPTDDSYPHTYEHSLDRVACALGGQAVLPPAFMFIPAMLASHDWRLRHAGLMAIASIAEGTSKVMQGELGRVIECVRVLSRLSLCARAHSRSQPGYPCVQRPASACALRGVSMHVSIHCGRSSARAHLTSVPQRTALHRSRGATDVLRDRL